MFKRKKKLIILQCQTNGTDFCPVEYDGHCLLKRGIDTSFDKIPDKCPLREYNYLLRIDKNA